MPFSVIFRRLALVRTDVSEELSTSFIRVTRIGELRTTLAVTSNGHAAKKYIPEDGILHSHRHEVKYELGFYIPENGIIQSHRRENLKSYKALAGWALLRGRVICLL
jgi:CRISPR/Cas system CMR subunit Cmr4 (Cas7 group RAMP superfamily)